ncbi:TIGR03084 family metal-binding protein [Streptomyces abyssomicinicus]|uniref:TIGR03084 family metal-binding protein n=1 Tax=Streptomyces abyssomicinicus TaxID=574929 RepID=UPI00124FE74D|nr:TIGR03084 family metal-binding protein [Streptomyces abyssomicinicus]
MDDPTSSVIDDMRAESDELDALVAELDDERWAAPTPAPGWGVAHQIAHLAWTDRAALAAIGDREAFDAEVRQALADPGGYMDAQAALGARKPPAELLATWREGRAELAEALHRVPRGTRIPWFGPPMSAASMATARLMETWAHGQDVADALGAERRPTGRLRHIARLGARTRDFAFLVNGLEAPKEEFHLELAFPDAGLWTLGPQDAPQRVTGSGPDFCLLVTQRAHRADLDLRAEGPDADRWLDIAQCFAGPPGAGRAPGERA